MMTIGFHTPSVVGKVGQVVDDLFESVCVPDDDLFFDFSAGAEFKAPRKTNETLEMLRASAASTQCPSSFSPGFDLSSFDSFDMGSHDMGSPFAQQADAPFVAFETGAMGRRAKNLAARVSPLDVPPPPAPYAQPVQDDDELPSIGAKLHATGDCLPCKFFRGRRGCKDGTNCQLCHHKHDELTYSGIRRMMRKKALEGRETEEAPAAAATAPWRPPPGLPEPQRGAAP